MGSYNESFIDYTCAIKLDSGLSVAWYNRGSARFMMQDYSAAINDYSCCIRLDTACMHAYKYRGIVRIKLNDREEGMRDISKAKDMGCHIDMADLETELSVNGRPL